MWLPNWPTWLAARRGVSTPERPFATVATQRGLRVLEAVCLLAEAAGLAPGMTLVQARAICAGLEVAAADPAAERAALTALAAWCERYTPLAAADPPDGLLLDITGCAHLLGGEAALATSLQRRLLGSRLAARVAVAGSAGAAWALARMLPGGTLVLPAGEEARALGPLPPALLRLDPAAVAGLRRLGVRRIDELARLPRGDLAARFGAGVRLRLDRALGLAAEPLVWPHPPAPWREQRGFAEPIGTAADLTRALHWLAGRLGARLAAARLGGTRFVAGFLRVDGGRAEIAVATARPAHDAAYVAGLLAAKLETVDPGFGVEAMTLEAAATGPRLAEQARLDGGTAAADDALARMVDALVSRAGADAVWRAAPAGSHLPERSLLRLPPLSPVMAPDWAAALAARRPVRLLGRPELLEVVAPLPDDPPLLFRWRGTLHRVRAAAGPERIAYEWWRQPAPSDREERDLVRDYYRVEDSAGGRFWLFRTGRQNGAAHARWFLHGMFG